MRMVMLWCAVGILCVPVWLAAQDGDDAAGKPGDVRAAWASFREAAAEDWTVRWGPGGTVAELSGSPIEVSAGRGARAARTFVGQHATLFALDREGMSLGDGTEERGEDGSSVVRFGVTSGKLPVLDAHVSVHFDRQGRVTAVLADSPVVDVRRRTADIDAERVRDVLAARHLERAIEYVAAPTLAVLRDRAGGRLVYRCQVRFDPALLGTAGAPPEEGEPPTVWRVLVDASSARIVSFEAQ